MGQQEIVLWVVVGFFFQLVDIHFILWTQIPFMYNFILQKKERKKKEWSQINAPSFILSLSLLVSPVSPSLAPPCSFF